MEAICNELGVPKKQIQCDRASNRYILIVKKLWLKNLAQFGRVGEFPVHPGLDEWPNVRCNIGNSWCKTHIQVKKLLIFSVYLPINS